MTIQYWQSVVQILSLIGGTLFALWKIWRKLDQHQANNTARSDVLEVRLGRIESQFGPNGGGLREAVNNISNNLKHIDTKLDNVSSDLSQLKGEYKEHVRRND